MISSSIIASYIQLQDDTESSTVLRRTRASTRKSINEYKAELKSVNTKKETTIVAYILDSRDLEIKVEDDEIIDMSCSDCLGR